MSARIGTSICRAVDRRPGRRRHRRDGADVVEVAVGEQDRLDLAHLPGGGEDPLRLLAGVDDEDAVGALAAQQEAVLGDRADREHLDVEAHRRALVALRAHPRPLAPPPQGHVDEVAGGDVEDEHEGAERQRGAERAFEDQQQQDEEDDGGDEAADDRAAPGRRQVGAGRRFAFGAGAGFRLGAAAGFGAACWCRCGRPGCRGACGGASSWSGPWPESNRSAAASRRSIRCRSGSKPRIGTSAG